MSLDNKVLPFPKVDTVAKESHIVAGTQAKVDERIWKCSCGCNSFAITPTKIVCWNCGARQVFGDQVDLNACGRTEAT